MDAEVKSLNDARFVYTAVRRAARKGAHPVLTGHEWRCLKCNGICHYEGLAGLDETPEAAAGRHRRIEDALAQHTRECKKGEADGSGE